MHDHRVSPIAEFLADATHTLLWRPGRRRLQPLVGNERRNVFDLLGGRLVVNSARDRRHHRVSPKLLQHSGIPVVGMHQQVAIALQVGGQSRDGFL